MNYWGCPSDAPGLAAEGLPRRRQSTWNISRIITSHHKTLDDHLVLPPGLLKTATKLVTEAGSKVESDDLRAPGDTQEFTVF